MANAAQRWLMILNSYNDCNRQIQIDVNYAFQMQNSSSVHLIAISHVSAPSRAPECIVVANFYFSASRVENVNFLRQSDVTAHPFLWDNGPLLCVTHTCRAVFALMDAVMQHSEDASTDAHELCTVVDDSWKRFVNNSLTQKL